MQPSARAKRSTRPALVIGFAAETGDVVAYATAKLKSKGADWIVANDVSPERGVFGGDSNTVHLVMPIRRRGLAAPLQGRGRRAPHAARSRAPAPIDSGGRMSPRGGERVRIRVVRLSHGVGLPLPAYQSKGAAGLDLIAAVDTQRPLTLAPGARALIPTGLTLELPAGL